MIKEFICILCLILLAQGAGSYKILTWNKTLTDSNIMMSNQTAFLNKFFNGDRGSFSVGEFQIDDKVLKLMIADGTELNYTKKLILAVNHNMPNLASDVDRIQKHQIQSCKTQLYLEEEVQTEELVKHWSKHNYQSQFIYNYTYVTQKQLVLYSKAIKISIKMEQFNLLDYFSDYLWVRNLVFLTFLFLLFEGVLYLVKIGQLKGQRAYLFHDLWPIGAITIRYIVSSIIKNSTYYFSWSFQAGVTILGSIMLLYILLKMMLERRGKDNKQTQSYLIYYQIGLFVIITFWFNWLTICIYTTCILFVFNQESNKLSSSVLKQKRVVSICLAVQLQLLLWLDSYNPGLCPYIFNRFQFNRIDFSWMDLLALEIAMIWTIISTLYQKESILSDEERQVLSRKKRIE